MGHHDIMSVGFRKQRLQDMIKTGRDGPMDQGMERDKATPFWRHYLGMIANESLPEWFAGGNKPDAGGRGLHTPIGMADESNLMASLHQRPAERKKGMKIAMRSPGNEQPAHSFTCSGDLEVTARKIKTPAAAG